MSEKEDSWSLLLNWLNIVRILDLNSIHQIPESKRKKAVQKLTKSFGIKTLNSLEPDELETLVASELKELMKKELSLHEKRREKMEKEMHSKIIPLKRGGIIRINPKDFKDFDPDADPEDLLKMLYKKFIKGDSDDNGEDDKGDEDSDSYYEDRTGYYI